MTKNFLYLILTVLLMNCRDTVEKHLYSKQNNLDKIAYINYEGDDIGGHFIIAEMTSNNLGYKYTFHIAEYEGKHDSGWVPSGTVLNVIKIESKFDDTDLSLDAERSLQSLVSDTSKRYPDSPRDPNFFGEPVNDYYDTFVLNHIVPLPNSVIKILKISDDEKHLLSVLDSVTKKNEIDYKNIDTSRVFGWFQYVF